MRAPLYAAGRGLEVYIIPRHGIVAGPQWQPVRPWTLLAVLMVARGLRRFVVTTIQHREDFLRRRNREVLADLNESRWGRRKIEESGLLAHSGFLRGRAFGGIHFCSPG